MRSKRVAILIDMLACRQKGLKDIGLITFIFCTAFSGEPSYYYIAAKQYNPALRCI